MIRLVVFFSDPELEKRQTLQAGIGIEQHTIWCISNIVSCRIIRQRMLRHGRTEG